MQVIKIIYLSSIMLLLAGCGLNNNSKQEVPVNQGSVSANDETYQENSADTSKNEEDPVTDPVNENAEIPIVISGEEIDTMNSNKEDAYIIVGDFNFEKYDLLLKNMQKVCEERDMKVYALDTGDKKNAEWLSNNQVIEEMNVAILSKGKLGIFDMKSDADYEILGELLTGLSQAMNNKK